LPEKQYSINITLSYSGKEIYVQPFSSYDHFGKQKATLRKESGLDR
jgi:rRNA maturation protein Nop10